MGSKTTAGDNAEDCMSNLSDYRSAGKCLSCTTVFAAWLLMLPAIRSTVYLDKYIENRREKLIASEVLKQVNKVGQEISEYSGANEKKASQVAVIRPSYIVELHFSPSK